MILTSANSVEVSPKINPGHHLRPLVAFEASRSAIKAASPKLGTRSSLGKREKPTLLKAGKSTLQKWRSERQLPLGEAQENPAE